MTRFQKSLSKPIILLLLKSLIKSLSNKMYLSNAGCHWSSKCFMPLHTLSFRITNAVMLVTSVVSDSVRPQRRQPTSLPRPWDSLGKNTGVGFHFLLQCRKVKNESEVAQSCPTLSDPMDCSLPGSSIHGIFQARVLEWGAIAFSEWLRLRAAYAGFLGSIPGQGTRSHMPPL